MRPSRLLACLTFACSLAFCGYAADIAVCPTTIAVEPQRLAKPIPGWTALSIDPPRHELESVTFFDGDPKDQASLAPDREDRLQNSWSFAPQDRPIWLTCHYSRTTVTIGRILPKTVKRCRVTFAANVSIGGLPLIQKIACD